MTDNRTRPVKTSAASEDLENLAAVAADLDAIFARCVETYAEVDLSLADFKDGVMAAVDKYLVGFSKKGETPTTAETRKFISELQSLDLYLTLACARGNEQAWWQFDRQHRSFIERLANQLVGRGMDANEVIDSVYADLYGTKTVDGIRQSKFRTYTGRGTLRGWLRTVITHTAVDLYRGRREEIPLEEWAKGGEEMSKSQRWRSQAQGGETSMLENVARERYRSVTIAALDQSLSTLDAHETLLLLYYHVEGLKLREIARIVETPSSSIRRWFQRRTKRKGTTPTRVHESTIMRWLDNVYRKVADRFHAELKNKQGLNPAEIEICLDIATEDFGPGVGLNLERPNKKNFGKEGSGDYQVEGTP